MEVITRICSYISGFLRTVVKLGLLGMMCVWKSCRVLRALSFDVESVTDLPEMKLESLLDTVVEYGTSEMEFLFST